MKAFKLTSFWLIIVFILSANTLLGSWFEIHNIGLGNTTFSNTSYPWGTFTTIPDSQYVVFGEDNYYMLIDVASGCLRGESENRFNLMNRIVIPDPHGGWNIFFTSDNRFGQLHIGTNGEFGEPNLIDSTYTGFPHGIGIPQRNEIWYFANRIFHFSGNTGEWKVLNYPDGWDPAFDYLELFPSYDLDSLIVIENGRSLLREQAMWMDTKTGETKLLSNDDPHFFAGINDIDLWKGRPRGYYLILKSNQVISYNITDGRSEVLMQDFECSSKNIMQDNTGKYLYMLGNNSLYILDIVDKTVNVRLLPLHDGDSIAFPGSKEEAIYDPDRGFIIFYIYNEASGYNINVTMIKLDDMSLTFLDNFPNEYNSPVVFIPSENKLMTTYKSQIYILDLDTVKRVVSISVRSYSNTWSTIPGEGGPTLFAEEDSTYFRKLKPLGNFDLYKCGDGTRIWNLIYYPGTDIAFFDIDQDQNNHVYREYYFKDDSVVDIQLPSRPNSLKADPPNGQLIGLNTYVDGALMYIKPGGQVQTWLPPESPNLQAAASYLDTENNFYWVVYKHKVASDYYFYKLSTDTQQVLDSFTMPAAEMEYPDELCMDDSRTHFFFIEGFETKQNVYDYYFASLDIGKRKIVSKILLQTNADFSGHVKSWHGIIPIPGHDKVFLWSNYGGWCIDTNTWEVLYGEVKDNPHATYSYSNYINGYWDEEKGVVEIVDLSYDGGTGGSDYKRILEADLSTGNIIKSTELPNDLIIRVFFSDDKQKIYLLSGDRPRFLVYNVNPAWEDPPSIQTSTHYLEYRHGDTATFNVHLQNRDKAQKASVYLWICAPGDITLFFNGAGFSPDIFGFSVILPANLDISGDIFSFEVPQILPEGLYSFNAIFLNENYEFGPMGTWSFYVRN